MAVKIETKNVGSAKEFLDCILAIVQSDDIALSRGQRDDSELVPSFWRKDKKTGDYKLGRYVEATKIRLGNKWHYTLPQGMDEGDAQLAIKYARHMEHPVDRLRDLAIWLDTETTMVKDFCGACDRVALPVPGYSDAASVVTIGHESTVHGWVPAYRLSAVFAFAQHYGVPTRLLDFSDSPLKAAYFAVEDIKAKTDFCVWVLRRSKNVPDYMATQEFRALRSQIPFLHAQDGVFLSCNIESNRFFMANQRWPKLEEVIEGWTIEKIVCPRAGAKAVRRWLKDFGISRLTMMPSYENVSRQVTNKLVVREKWKTAEGIVEVVARAE
jgi:hypothetical protein